MLTFIQYLTEKLYGGFDYEGAYIEIFKNPTENELIAAGQKPVPKMYVPVALGGGETGDYVTDEQKAKIKKLGLRGSIYYIGGILTSKDLYVFDRGNTQHHDVDRQIEGLDRENYIPIYIYYFAGPSIIALDVSMFSVGDTLADHARRAAKREKIQGGLDRSPAEIHLLQRAAKHPKLRKFKLIDMDANPIA